MQLQARVERVLEHLERPQPSSAERVNKQDADRQELLLTYLESRARTDTLADCPLPELYRHLQGGCPSLTVGQYHDALRRLSEDAEGIFAPLDGAALRIARTGAGLARRP